MKMQALLLHFLELFPGLIRLYWILAAGAVITTILPLPVPQAFKDAVVLSAARGKLWHVKPTALGPLKDASVPQAWFLHFYVVGAVFNLLLLVSYALQFYLRLDPDAPQLLVEPLVAMSVFQLHLVRRALETRLLMRYPADAKMHLLAYIFGLSYYLVLPLSLIPEPAFRQLISLLGSWVQQLPALAAQASSGAAAGLQQHVAQQLQQLAAVLAQAVSGYWQAASPVQWLGLLVFLCGNVLQHHSHALLAQLGRGSSKAGGEKEQYKVPRGGAFELVSCPHYLAELVIYLGLLLLGPSCRLVLGLVLVWVGSNLVLAADATHKWYLHRFPAYPKRRRALLPYIF